jgi:hypothetical protein
MGTNQSNSLEKLGRTEDDSRKPYRTKLLALSKDSKNHRRWARIVGPRAHTLIVV